MKPEKSLTKSISARRLQRKRLRIEMVESQIIREFDLVTFIENLRSQERDADSDEKLFCLAAKFFKEFEIGPLLQLSGTFAEMLLGDFKHEGVEKYAKRLKSFGVHDETLFVALLLFVFMPQIDKTLREGFGGIKERRKKAEPCAKRP